MSLKNKNWLRFIRGQLNHAEIRHRLAEFSFQGERLEIAEVRIVSSETIRVLLNSGTLLYLRFVALLPQGKRMDWQIIRDIVCIEHAGGTLPNDRLVQMIGEALTQHATWRDQAMVRIATTITLIHDDELARPSWVEKLFFGDGRTSRDIITRYTAAYLASAYGEKALSVKFQSEVFGWTSDQPDTQHSWSLYTFIRDSLPPALQPLLRFYCCVGTVFDFIRGADLIIGLADDEYSRIFIDLTSTEQVKTPRRDVVLLRLASSADGKYYDEEEFREHTRDFVAEVLKRLMRSHAKKVK